METRKVQYVRKKTMKRLPLRPLNRIYDGDKTAYDNIPILYEIFIKYAPLSKIALPFRNFYHIGSDSGKLVIGMAYMNSTLKTTGIETTPEKVMDGNLALEKVRDLQVKRRVELLCISPFDESVKYANACWIYLSNNTEEQLVHKLANDVKKGCIVVCANPLFNPAFVQLNYITLDSKVYVYSRV